MEGQGYLKYHKHTFSNGVVFALDDADHNDGNDDDGQSGHDRHNQIDIGHKSQQLGLEVTKVRAPGHNVVTNLPGRGKCACK